jgi:hypothetical protein
MKMRFALAIVAGIAVAPFALGAPSFADDAKMHHTPKTARPAKLGAHGSAPKGFGGGAAGVAAGLFGAAIGASVVDALTHASDPDAAPAAAAPAGGCHYEIQPLFDASGQQVASRRVRVCN